MNYPMLCFKEIPVSSKLTAIPSVTLSRNHGLRKLHRGTSTVAAFQRLTTLATFDFDRRAWPLNVYPSAQYDANKAARRAGPSATVGPHYDEDLKVAHTQLPSVGFRS